MTFTIINHWLLEAKKIESPNCNDRPHQAINLLVIHGISLPAGHYGGDYITDLFMNNLDSTAHNSFTEIAPLKVSAHILIRRDGELIQYVPFNKRAWHAGASSFKGQDNCNDFSIGVELEGTDAEPYEQIQYAQLALLTQTLMQTYPKITKDRIVGHSDIAPERKTDPGKAFDWNYYRSLLGQS